MEYTTFEPQDDIGSFVKCYWTLDGPEEKTNRKQRILPDACMEMIFHHGDLYKQYTKDGNSIIQPRCFVFGQIRNFLEIEPTGRTGIFAVRFHPEGFMPFARIPLKDMENRAVPLRDLFGDEACELETAILQAESVFQRISLIEAFLSARSVDKNYLDQSVKATVDLILKIKGQASVNQLSRHINIHRRQMERKCLRAIGLSPKQLSKIIRLQHACTLLLARKQTPLTEIAHQGEYYDQAHFIKDFKEFTGVTPKQFFADNLKMSALFSGAD